LSSEFTNKGESIDKDGHSKFHGQTDNVNVGEKFECNNQSHQQFFHGIIPCPTYHEIHRPGIDMTEAIAPLKIFKVRIIAELRCDGNLFSFKQKLANQEQHDSTKNDKVRNKANSLSKHECCRLKFHDQCMCALRNDDTAE